MLSNHYPLAFATRWNWVIAALVFLMGVTIRHWFNTRHARAGNPWWTWAATALLFAAIVWLSGPPEGAEGAGEEAREAMSAGARVFAEAQGFAEVRDIVLGRCSMCHARAPAWEGIAWPPRGVVLETDAEIAAHAREVYLQAGASHAMPPANVTFMEEEERSALRRWYRAAAGG